MQALANGLSMLLAKVASALKWIGDLFVAIFVAAWEFLADMVCWIMDEFMKIAVTVLGGIDVSQMQSAAGWWSGLPAEITNMLGLVGLGTAMSIIISAIGIRLILQLIPFTRLGS